MMKAIVFHQFVLKLISIDTWDVAKATVEIRILRFKVEILLLLRHIVDEHMREHVKKYLLFINDHE